MAVRFAARLLLFGLFVACRSDAVKENTAGKVTESKADSGSVKNATRFQAASAQTGTVLILGYSTVGKISGLYGTSVEIEARELQEPNTKSGVYGLRIQVKQGGDALERENASFVDYDEVEPLLAGIEFITNTNRSSTKLQNFQADYRTRGDLVVSTFNGESGQIMAAVKSGEIGGASAYLTLSQLGKLKDLISAAKQQLDSVRTTPSTP